MEERSSQADAFWKETPTVGEKEQVGIVGLQNHKGPIDLKSMFNFPYNDLKSAKRA